MVVVKVRQRTLGVDGRSWGPATNIVDRKSQLSRRTRRTTRTRRTRRTTRTTKTTRKREG